MRAASGSRCGNTGDDAGPAETDARPDNPSADGFGTSELSEHLPRARAERVHSAHRYNAGSAGAQILKDGLP